MLYSLSTSLMMKLTQWDSCQGTGCQEHPARARCQTTLRLCESQTATACSSAPALPRPGWPDKQRQRQWSATGEGSRAHMPAGGLARTWDSASKSTGNLAGLTMSLCAALHARALRHARPARRSAQRSAGGAGRGAGVSRRMRTSMSSRRSAGAASVQRCGACARVCPCASAERASSSGARGARRSGAPSA